MSAPLFEKCINRIYLMGCIGLDLKVYDGKEIKLEDGTTKQYTDIILHDLTYLSDGKREEQPVTNSNDTGAD